VNVWTTRAATSGVAIIRRISAMTTPSTIAADKRVGPAPGAVIRFWMASIET
jgi:hypothetical protein